MAASADLVVNIVTKLSGDGMAAADKQTSKFKSGLATASKVAGAALIGIGAAAIGAANAAAEDAKSQELLANSMVNAAGASKAQIAATESWIDAQSRATGVADDELRPALGSLVRATGDVQKSQKALAIAMDVSAATGKPLQSVADAMAKGFAGNTSALSRLVPGISQAAIKSGNFARVLDEVHKKTDGAAKAAGETAAGKMARFKNSLGETQEAIGGALLPVLDKLSGLLVKVGQWAQDHGTLFAIIAAGVAIFAAAILALNLAVTIYTAVTTLAGSATLLAWGAVLLPILAVVAAVALVVGIVILLWHKSETFRTIVLAVWGAIKTAAKATGKVMVAAWHAVSEGAQKMGAVVRAVWGAIRSAGRAVATVLRVLWRAVWLAITLYVRAYLAVIRLVFSAIRTATSAVVGWIKDKWRAMWDAVKAMAQGLKDRLSSVWDAVKSAVTAVTDFISQHWSAAIDKVKGSAAGVGAILAKPFDTMKAAIQGVIDLVGTLISKLASIHVPKISLPHIPGVNSAAAPPVAAAGVGAFAAPAVPTARSGTQRAAAGGLTINVYGAVDPEGTARQVQRILTGHGRRIGLQVS